VRLRTYQLLLARSPFDEVPSGDGIEPVHPAAPDPSATMYFKSGWRGLPARTGPAGEPVVLLLWAGGPWPSARRSRSSNASRGSVTRDRRPGARIPYSRRRRGARCRPARRRGSAGGPAPSPCAGPPRRRGRVVAANALLEVPRTIRAISWDTLHDPRSSRRPSGPLLVPAGGVEQLEPRSPTQLFQASRARRVTTAR